MTTAKVYEFPEPEEGAQGFTKWVTPTMRRYMMACCDCGLVHEMQFKAIVVTEHLPDGDFMYEELPDKAVRVAFRVRRATKATKALRKKQS